MLWIDEIEKYLSVVQSSGAINGDVFSYMDARENVSGVRNIMRKKNFSPNILCTFASNKSQEWCAKRRKYHAAKSVEMI